MRASSRVPPGAAGDADGPRVTHGVAASQTVPPGVCDGGQVGASSRATPRASEGPTRMRGCALRQLRATARGCLTRDHQEAALAQDLLPLRVTAAVRSVAAAGPR